MKTVVKCNGKTYTPDEWALYHVADAYITTPNGDEYMTDDGYNWYKDGSTASGTFKWEDVYKLLSEKVNL